MMAPFDGPGGPQNGNPAVAPPPLARPPNMQPNQQHQGMHQQHQGGGGNGGGGPMGHHGGPYGQPHHGSMQQMPPHQYGGMPSQSPANAAGRQGSYGGGGPRGMHGNQFSGHPPLHSPQGMPPHPGMQQPLHRNSSGMSSQSMRGMPMAHDAMRSNSNNTHTSRGQYGMDNSASMGGSGRGTSMGGPPGNNNSNSSGGTSGGGGNWQSDKDTPHRRDMIQHM